jgi:hypothetical protein
MMMNFYRITNKIPKHLVEVLVTPSPPSVACAYAAASVREQRSDFHLHIVADFTEGATGVADPKVVDPTGECRIDPLP